MRTFALILASLPLLGLLFQTIGTAVDALRFPPPGQMVDVGGFRLHLHCEGSGAPTVLLDAGMGDNTLHWTRVMPAVAGFTRVCAYDRAGLGWSESGPEPRSSTRIAGELSTLLDSAQIGGDLVLAGHSFGAFNARVFAAQHPDRVAGMVLVDGADPEWWRTHEGKARAHAASAERRRQGWMARFGLVRLYSMLMRWGILPTPHTIRGFLAAMPDDVDRLQIALWSRAPYYFATANQWDAMAASGLAVTKAGQLGNVPLVVVTAGDNDTAAQKETARLSTRGRQVVAQRSGHDVHIESPETVIEAIRAVVTAARARSSGR